MPHTVCWCDYFPLLISLIPWRIGWSISLPVGCVQLQFPNTSLLVFCVRRISAYLCFLLFWHECTVKHLSCYREQQTQQRMMPCGTLNGLKYVITIIWFKCRGDSKHRGINWLSWVTKNQIPHNWFFCEGNPLVTGTRDSSTQSISVSWCIHVVCKSIQIGWLLLCSLKNVESFYYCVLQCNPILS